MLEIDNDDLWIQDLAQNHRSGAAEIVAHVAERLRPALATWIADPERLARFGLRCITAQPSMAPLINLFNDLVWGMEQSPSDLSSVERILEAYLKPGSCVPLPPDFCPPGSFILTHSYSFSVLNALSQSAGRVHRVICLESRPLFEGRILAERLSRKGVPVTVVVDASMAEMIERVDLIVVGADCIHPGGLINKQGARALATLAKAMGKKIIDISSRMKILGREATRRFITIAEQNPHEVWSSPPDGVSIENRYFDTTPLDYFAALFLDDQLVNRQELQGLLESHRLHPLLSK